MKESARATAANTPHGPLLELVNLQTTFQTDEGLARPVDGVSFSVNMGETVAVVGESGSGKTVTALSILRLIPESPGNVVAGEIKFAGRNLLELDAAELEKVRGGEIAMIFQEPSTSLNPVFTIGDQIAEGIRLHREMPEPKVIEAVLEAVSKVRISEPQRCVQQYPHELSGGIKQRAMIAMALACQPRLLIADEPTTALDVTIQACILDLLREVQRDRDMAILLITHDLGVVAEMADQVVVMYAGKVVERASVKALFSRPLHPYTDGLLHSVVRIDRTVDQLQPIEGNVPPPTHYPSGCRFKERCRLAAAKCDTEPPLAEVAPGHLSACWFAKTLLRPKRPESAASPKGSRRRERNKTPRSGGAGT